jgi:predicted nucleotidyltransferase
MIDLTSEQIQIVRRILSQYVPGLPARIFGSRVNGRAKPHSDLDLALMTDQPLPPLTGALLRDAFSESDLPFKVDIVDWAEISESFRKVIEEKNEIFQIRA